MRTGVAFTAKPSQAVAFDARFSCPALTFTRPAQQIIALVPFRQRLNSELCDEPLSRCTFAGITLPRLLYIQGTVIEFECCLMDDDKSYYGHTHFIFQRL